MPPAGPLDSRPTELFGRVWPGLLGAVARTEARGASWTAASTRLSRGRAGARSHVGVIATILLRQAWFAGLMTRGPFPEDEPLMLPPLSRT